MLLFLPFKCVGLWVCVMGEHAYEGQRCWISEARVTGGYESPGMGIGNRLQFSARAADQLILLLIFMQHLMFCCCRWGGEKSPQKVHRQTFTVLKARRPLKLCDHSSLMGSAECAMLICTTYCCYRLHFESFTGKHGFHMVLTQENS